MSENNKQRIFQCIDAQPDVTIAELIDRLGLKASYPTVARIVHGMGCRVKKKSLRASKQECPRCSGQAYTMERARAGK